MARNNIQIYATFCQKTSYRRARTIDSKLYYIKLLKRYKFDDEIRKERRQLYTKEEREANYSRRLNVDKALYKAIF